MDRDKIVIIAATNIMKEMERRGMDGSSLARAAGLNPTGVYDILSGKSRSPRLDTIAKIANALNIDVAQLISMPTKEELKDEIYSIFSDLDSDEQEKLLQIARAWASARK